MAVYLKDNPPRIRQFRPRRASLWPVIGVHTAESYPDESGPDTGAENVARFIRDRTNYGSYHCLSDSDSRIQLVPFDQAAYHIGTHGLNDRTIGISAATQAAKWNQLDNDYVEAMVRNMARDAADAARYIKAKTGRTVPARRITLAQALDGQAGFLAHGDADPDRRTDPGKTFPWGLFLDTYADLMGGATPEPKDWFDMATEAQLKKAVDEALADDILRLKQIHQETRDKLDALEERLAESDRARADQVLRLKEIHDMTRQMVEHVAGGPIPVKDPRDAKGGK